MDSKERLAFRILASLYPDRKPSEVRKIIEDALAKEECSDDVELWMVLAKEKVETPKEEVVKERIIEHHYHDYYYNPFHTYTTDHIEPHKLTDWTITCNGIDNVVKC